MRPSSLHAVHAYIWSLAPGLAKYLSWADAFTGNDREKVFWWINLPDPDLYLGVLRSNLLIFSVSGGRVVQRKVQLTAGLGAFRKKHAMVNAGTSSGGIHSMVIPLLMVPDAVAIIIFPLKCL